MRLFSVPQPNRTVRFGVSANSKHVVKDLPVKLLNGFTPAMVLDADLF
jgi:hypothetical protein